MKPNWRRLWVAGFQTIPTVLIALALTWFSYGWATSIGSVPLAVAAALLTLTALVALLGLDLNSPWSEAALLVMGALIGIVLGTWEPVLLDKERAVIVVGSGLTLAAGAAGGTLSLQFVARLTPWLNRLAWLYLLGWIPILAADTQRPYRDAWAGFGLLVFVMLIATWPATVQARDALEKPARASLQLYLLGLNVFLALTIVLPSGA